MRVIGICESLGFICIVSYHLIRKEGDGFSASFGLMGRKEFFFFFGVLILGFLVEPFFLGYCQKVEYLILC